MRPEDFDIRLQQKLDELNPVFKEQDWIRLSKKMNKTKSPVLFSKRISMILLLLCLVLFGTWMSFHWAALKPGSQLDNTIQKDELPTPVIAESSNLKMNDNLDKPSITQKAIEKANQLESNNETTSTQIASNSIGNEGSKSIYATSNKTNSVESSLSDKHSISNALVRNEKITSLNSKSDNKQSTNNSGIDEKVIIAEAKVQEQTLINKIPENGLQENLSMKGDDHSMGNQIPENQNSELSVISPLHSLAIQGLVNNDKIQIRSRIKPVTGLKPYKWVVGVTGLVAASHFNTGLVFEIKTKKSISFGSGLVVQKYLEQDYLDQNEFAATNEADFKELIRPRHSKSISFTNIKIKSLDVLLPLSLKYYYPLSTQLALYANASMQLTLYSKTSLDFQSLTQDDQILNVTDFDQASNSATLINHFTFGGGLQREFKNFVIQTGFLVQKNNSNQPQITKQEMAGQLSILYKL